MNQQAIKDTVRNFLLSEFLPGEAPSALTDATALMTTGILDSIAVLKLVTFLENEFKVTLQAHETGVENLNTLTDIANLVASKAP